MSDDRLETTLIAMMLDSPKLIDNLYVQDYFYTRSNKDLLEAILEEYAISGTCDFVVLVAKKPQLEKLFLKGMEYDTSPIQFDYYQQGLIEEYKNHMCVEYYEQYAKGNIERDEYIKLVSSLSDELGKANANYDSYEDVLSEFDDNKNMLKFQKFEWLGKELSLPESVLYVLGAKPAIGKTALAINLITDLAKNKDYQIVYFNYEMAKKKIHARIIGSEQLLPVGKLEDKEWLSQDNNFSERAKAIRKLSDYHFIFNDTITYSNAIRNYVKSICRSTNKHVIVVIDTINYVDVKGVSDETQKMTKATRALMTMCKELNCTCIALAHIRRDATTLDMNVLKQSGELEQSAHAIFLLDRVESDDIHKIDKLKMVVAKNRDGETKEYQIDFYKSTQRMEIN